MHPDAYAGLNRLYLSRCRNRASTTRSPLKNVGTLLSTDKG